MRFARNRDRGVALLVVVSVLAVLSLLIATFAMLMSIEATAARNQTEYVMAVQAAHTGLDHLITSLRANPGLANAGNFDALCSDPQNPSFCRELLRRDGLKSGYLIHPADSATNVHANLAGQPWAGIPTAPVGSLSTGMFDINGMGFAADSDCYMTRGVRYTSSEASLYQTLCSVFDTVSNTLPSAGNTIDNYLVNPSTSTTFTTDPAVRYAVAKLLAHAIVSYRYGDDGMPGGNGFEEHHYEHLGHWYRCWPNYWAGYGDTGASVSGLFWGRVAGYAAGVVTVDNTQRNWRDWTANQWVGACVYFATGTNKALQRAVVSPIQYNITANGTNTLTVTPTYAPSPGDWFCILPSSAAYAEFKVGRVNSGAGDLIPDIPLWPNNVPAGEPFVFPLHYIFYPPYNNLLAEGVTPTPPLPAPAPDELYVGPAFAANWLNPSASGFFSVRILDGIARGQVRRILNNTNDAGARLQVSAAWTTPPPVGSRYRVEYDALPAYAYVVDAAANPVPAGGPPATLRVLGSPWSSCFNAFSGCVVTISYDTNAAAVGQSRHIVYNNANTLYLSRTWDTIPTPGTAQFRIELPQDYKYAPDQLTGDDLSYKSVAEVLSVISSALAGSGAMFHNPALTTAQANSAAAILYSTGYAGDATHPPLKDVLTIANNLIGTKQQYVSINDWSCDGIDNNRDGVIDDTGEAGYEDTDAHKSSLLAAELYRGLGLLDWVDNATGGAGDTRTDRLRLAAQLIANIIDFRDTDDRPTHLTIDNVDPSLGAGEFTPPVNGYEAVHFTEIMCAPPVIDRTKFLTGAESGTELYDDGKVAYPPGGVSLVTTPDGVTAPVPPNFVELKDSLGWDWDQPSGFGWKVAGPSLLAGQVYLGTWRFDATRGYGFKTGWYAIRLHFTNVAANTVLTFKTVTPAQNGHVVVDAAGWGYARLDSSNKLMAVRVNSNTDTPANMLEFQIGAGSTGMTFDSFQLLPQFIEVTNCAAHDVSLDSLEIIAASSQIITFPTSPACKIDGSTVVNTGTTFPPRYGTFVIALSEEAYARNYGTVSTDGSWGNAGGENHYVLFVGDRWSGEGADTNANARAEIFRFGNAAAPTIPALKLRSNGDIVAATGTAATDYDGDPNATTLSAPIIYESREKAVSPFSTSWTNYDTAVATTLGASQNRSYGAGTYGRTCLNRNYDACWSGGAAGYPALFTTAGGFAAGLSRVYPVILNRPYPSPGWLGLVPTGNLPWRTVDSNPTLGTEPDAPEKLLGLFLSRAIVGGVNSRINLNNPATTHTAHALRSILSSADVTALTGARPAGGWGASYTTASNWYRRFVGWEELLNNAAVRNISATSPGYTPGAGTIQPAAFDDPDQNEEFVRRYGNLIDLRTSNLKFVIAGLVYENGARPGAVPPVATDTPDPPVAQVRIEIEIDMSGPARVVQFRYLTE